MPKTAQSKNSKPDGKKRTSDGESASVANRDSRLTVKQRRFISEYLVDFNGSQAAIRAGYSKNRARQTSDDLMKNEEIVALIDRGLQDKERRAEVTADRVVVELAKVAFASATELEELAPQNRFGTTAKMADKTKALELLAKHFGLLIEKHEHSGEVAGRAVVVWMPKNGTEVQEDDGGAGVDD